VPKPKNADIIIANTYPFDTSLKFSRKGWWPIYPDQNGKTNILIGNCSMEVTNNEKFVTKRYRKLVFRRHFVIFLHSPLKAYKILLKKIPKIIGKIKEFKKTKKKIIYFQPERESPLFDNDDLHFETSWSNILEMLKKEYRNRCPKVIIYPCAPLQFTNESDNKFHTPGDDSK
jgi:hypothetical protein